MPEKMPPIRIPGVTKAGKASKKLRTTSPSLGRGWTGYSFVLAVQKMRSIRLIPIISPGIIPPMSKAPMETSPITPKMTRGMLGGIIGPMMEEAAVIAALNSRS